MIRRAAIDIGTNSVRLFVADVSDAPRALRCIRPVLRRLTITRLGEGLGPGRRIRPAAASRTAASVRAFVSLAESAGVPEPIVVGTYALRVARNPEVLLRRLRLPVRVLTGEEEARLGFQGVLAGLSLRRRSRRHAYGVSRDAGIVTVDIGGGSVEFVMGGSEGIRETHSLPLGCVVLTQRFLRHDPPQAGEVAALRRHLAETLEPVLPGLRRRRFLLAGVGGTITTMAALAQRLRPYDPDRVHGYRLTAAAVRHLTATLLETPLAKRRRMPGLQPERADIISAGALVLAHVLAALDRRTLVVSEADLLWALVLQTGAPAT